MQEYIVHTHTQKTRDAPKAPAGVKASLLTMLQISRAVIEFTTAKNKTVQKRC